MSTYKFTYFDFDGGRGEPVRILLHASGIAFEDHRISFEEFGQLRSTFPLNAVPVLEIDGKQITQSNAMMRYVGKLKDLYPTDPMQALYCDEVLGALEDMTHALVQTFSMKGEELKAARLALAEGKLKVMIQALEAMLLRGGGHFFSDNRLTIADIKCFVQMGSLTSGNLDHIPTDLVATVAPNLAQHFERMKSESIIQAYYASRV